VKGYLKRVKFWHGVAQTGEADFEAMVFDPMDLASPHDTSVISKHHEDWMICEDQRLLDEQRVIKPMWCWNKDGALCHGKVYGDQCLIARDAGDKKNFATMPDSTWLPTLVEATAVPERVFYECLAIGMLFKGYMDVEYLYDSAEHADAHLVIALKMLSCALREYFPGYLNDNRIPVFGIVVATRPLPEDDPSGKLFKISYHIVLQNLFFRSPVQLGRFVKWFVAEEELAAKRALEDVDGNGGLDGGGLDQLVRDVPPHKIFDLKPYCKFQQMRMPLSTKMKGGTQSVLLGLCTHFDPFSHQLPEFKFSNDVEAHKNLFLTLINEPLDFIKAQTVDEDYAPPADVVPNITSITTISKASGKQGDAGRARSQQCREVCGMQVPSPVASFVHDCLREYGATCHRVHGRLVDNPNGSFCIPLSIQCSRDGEQRRCPLQQTGEKAHESNNQRILIQANGRILIMCHSKRCEGRRLPLSPASPAPSPSLPLSLPQTPSPLPPASPPQHALLQP